VIRILLGQRGTLVRAAFAQLLSQEADLQVIADMDDADQLLGLAVRECPEVIMLHGTVTMEQTCCRLCEAVQRCAVLMLLDGPAGPTSLQTLARLAPRVGALPVDATPDQLVDGIRKLARGEPVLDTRIALAALTASNSPLTPREREILRRAAAGLPAKEIAAEFFLAVGTVRNYLSSIITKTGARTRIEAIRIAQDSGWI
jgi:two-component system, NarL family, response regulator DesR